MSATLPLADTVRVATFNTELSRKGPGLLLRDVAALKEPQVIAVLEQIKDARPDIIVLQGIDYDLQNLALAALADTLDFPYYFSAPPNAGRMTSLDLDGNGKTGEPRDAQGYGRFFGQGAMALLSKHPILVDEVQDYSALLWRDMPGAILPQVDAAPFPSAEAQAIQRLSSNGHWAVPVQHPTFGRITILTYHATPPVFDGPEDLNGRRNHDETAFWALYMDGIFSPPPEGQFILMGDANLDPENGDGRSAAISALLNDPRILDPLPGQPTVTFTQTGPLRGDYILPSTDWTVTGAQVAPPDPDASRHSLVWVDLKP